MGQQLICVYRKHHESVAASEEIIARLFPGENIEYELYTDRGIDNIALRRMKRDLVRNGGGIAILSSVRILGTASDDVLRELVWMQQNKTILLVVDTPTSQTLDPVLNAMIVTTLVDVYRTMPSSNVTSFRTGAGRKRIQYPENWDELYEEWEDDLITAREFMERADLRKGTFYHLVASYRAQLDSIKETRQIG